MESSTDWINVAIMEPKNALTDVFHDLEYFNKVKHPAEMIKLMYDNIPRERWDIHIFEKHLMDISDKMTGVDLGYLDPCLIIKHLYAGIGRAMTELTASEREGKTLDTEPVWIAKTRQMFLDECKKLSTL